ncbi:potassium-transporting ATPase [Cutibacterium acnes JCM 18918]|nr:potassium-transporting ATPase [Cutibacterium acnes JCM 18918]
MPIAAVAAFLLIAGGAVQNFTGFLHVTGVAGGNQVIPGGPVASQEAIKELGTNGGGFFNGNSSHPSRIRNRGRTCSRSSSSCSSRSRCLAPSKMVEDVRQGRAILAAMVVLFTVNLCAMAAAEFSGHGTAARLAGAPMEGKEQRFGLLSRSSSLTRRR